jgi:hypothetical protein
MSKEIIKADNLEVVTAEQGTLIDRAKVYSQAHAQTEMHERMYLFLVGATLQQLKDITPHGGFEKLKQLHFAAEQTSRLGRAMNFAEAVVHFARGKFPTIGNLEEGNRLLLDSELKDGEKEKLAEEIAKATKGKGVMETIGDWRKKVHKEKTKAEPPASATDVAAQKMKAASDFATALRAQMALGQKNQHLALIPDAELVALDDERIELGRYIASLRKNRKAKKQ